MDEPELHGDESIILKTPNVFVKSLPFEAILTNKRIILIDRKKDLLPPKDILLATVRSVDTSENAIRDQVLTLSIITNSGETRQVVFTFSREAGGNRKRERDEWAKLLKQHTTSSFQQVIRNVIPSLDNEQKKKSQEIPTPKIEITSRPAGKKEIDAVQPMKKIVETTPLPPIPVETSSLPVGSFCSRCGNRVPPESVFCNRCGSKVVAPGALETVAPSTPQPAPQTVPQVSVPPLAQIEVPLADQNAPPHIPMVSAAQLERKERPIEEVIRSIEPLIENSVPRTEPAPLVPSHIPPGPEPEEQPGASTAIPPAGEPVPQPAAPTAQPPQRNRSILPQLFLRKDLPQQPAPATIPPVSPLPAGSPAPGSRRTIFAAIAIIIVIIAVIGGAFVFTKSLQGKQGEEPIPTAIPSATPTPTPLPTTAVPITVETTIPVPTASPQPLIPKTGVWVKVSFAGLWTGSYGTPGNQAAVSGSGDQFFQVPVSEGIIQVSFQKRDGSGNILFVEIYKNGTLIKSAKTTVPKGSIEVLADLKPPATPTVKPAINQTAVNTTATPTGNVTTVQTTTPVTTTTTHS
jgi:hypothetical protein